MTRAVQMVLMEPEYEFVNELQAYGRIHRIGQKNRCSFSYGLIDPASEVERRIIDGQKTRKEQMGIEVEGLEFEGLEFEDLMALHSVASAKSDF